MKVKCPHCFQKYSITEDQIGIEIKCQVCDNVMVFGPPLELKEEKPHIQLLTGHSPTRNVTSIPPLKSSKGGAGLVTVLIIGVLALITGYFIFDNLSSEDEDVVSTTVKNAEIEERENKKSEAEKEAEAEEQRKILAKLELEKMVLAKKKEEEEERLALLQHTFEGGIVPILERTCMDCHDEVNEEGDLNLEPYLKESVAETNPDLWEKIVKVISLEQMPPSKRKEQLTTEDKRKLQTWVLALSKKWNVGEMGQDPGKTNLHRLNKYEYNYTIRNLFGLNIWLADQFPEDGTGDSGFSNNANALFLPSLLLENYFEAAAKIVDVIYANPQARSRYLFTRPIGVKTNEATARKILNYWSTYIYRKPADKTELARLLNVFNDEFSKKKKFDEAMKAPLFVMLVSPNFLYRSNLSSASKEVKALDDFELASKLSYFLWSSTPDRELLRLANNGELSKEEVLIAQVKRMLVDEKSFTLGKHLGGQWFGWEDLRGAANPDEQKFPEFNLNLRATLYRESAMYFNHLVKTNGSVYDLLDSDYAFVNDLLAKFYNLPPVSGSKLRMVKLQDTNRGGVLGMGSVLTSTSLALRSSPSIRGAFVLKNILGIPLPEPPMNVEPLPEDDKDLGEMSVRDSLEAHRTNPDCKSCHSEIDPIGFGLEAFDAIGRFRTHQNGQEIDTSGTMPDGTTFSSPAELKKSLLEHKDTFAKNTAKKFLTYALGRELNAYDRPVVYKIANEIVKNNGSMHTAIIEVVKSYPFRYRRGDKYEPIKPQITKNALH